MRFINKRRKSWGFVLLVVTLVVLAWVAVPLAQGATITVTSTADSGPGSLRQALLDAVSGDTITFDTSVFPPGSPATIALSSELPHITQGNLTIDGSNAGVILDGSDASHGAGLTVRSDNNVVRGLQIYYFPEVGIEVSSGADHNTIGGDRTSGSGPTGEGNVLSGNGVDGIAIDSDYNLVRGNFIGVDFSGESDLGNNTEGVRIRGGAYNVIGGETEGQRNIISGNGNNGVLISRESHDNTVSGNFVGTDLDGRQAIPNDGYGVLICESSYDNLVGGDIESERNLISGNDKDGVTIWGTATMTNTVGNTVSGNYIGTDVNGTVAIPNDGDGVHISNGARHNVIGGNNPGERNVISGNDSVGVSITDSATMNNTVHGNYIGTDANGTAAIPNDGVGVVISEGASYNVIGGVNAMPGGVCSGACNLISGNGDNGVKSWGTTTVGNIVSGNYIGTDVSGTAAMPNGGYGVGVADGASHNLIGGDSSGERNLIASSGEVGVRIWGAGTANNTISGNYIGSDVHGTSAFANNDGGIYIADGASYNVVGGVNATPEGACSGECNLISGNGGDGVRIKGTNTMSNIVSGNYIGTDASGTVAIPNDHNGVGISDGVSYNLIGGETPSERNIISGNGEFGVGLWDTGTSFNTIEGNYIGTDLSGTAALGNQKDGVHMNGASHNQVIDNLISGNEQSGVHFCCTSETSYNTVQGNYIGTDASGAAALGNDGEGVSIYGGAAHNEILNNVISGNGPRNRDEGTVMGIGIGGGNYNRIAGNYVGTDASGAVAIPNTWSAVFIADGAHHNVIGGASEAERNLLSGNGGHGIEIRDNGTEYNIVSGNYIGPDITGMETIDNPNPIVHDWPDCPEIYIWNGASHNVIGGTSPAERNVIAGSPGEGILISGNGTSNNTVSGNLIGTDASGAAPLSNAEEGIQIRDGARCNLIGGSTTSEGNIIAYNDVYGVYVHGTSTLSNTISHNSIHSNADKGIELTDGGNAELAAPVITNFDLDAGTVTGTTCANCTVEIFSDSSDEGEVYEGQVTADGAGNFAFNKGDALAGPNVTATATDAAGNTSSFSPLFEILWVDLGLDYTRWALDRLGLSYTQVAVGDFAGVNLSDYDVLFVGSTNEPVPDDVLQPLMDRKTDIATFVQAGGGLVALSEGGDWGQYRTSLSWNWVPITLTVDTNAVTHRTHIIAPTHALVEGLTDADFFYWWGAHGDTFVDWEWPEATSVVQASQAGRSALLAGPYGSGRMVLTGVFPDWEGPGDPILEALLKWAAGRLPDTPPHITCAYPDAGGWAATNTRLRLTFNQLISPTTVTDGVLTAVADSGPVAGTLDFLPDIAQICFAPDAPLTPGEQVTATLAATVTDWNGNLLDGNGDGTGGDAYTWRFTVRAGETLTVTSMDNDGPGTLRQALEDALPGDTITFDPTVFPPDAPETLAWQGGLPALDDGYVTLDASNAGVFLDGSESDWSGLQVTSDGNVIRGLTLANVEGACLHIREGAAFNLIGGDRTLGVGPNGQGNTIGHCRNPGIFVEQGGTINNTFLGNYLGTDPTGSIAWPNGEEWGAGLFIANGADYTTIGSNVPGERNLLSGNQGDGLDINESYYVIVLNNYLGTDASGTAALPNRECGLDLQGGSRYNYFEGNVFSGNDSCGVQTDDPGTGYNEFVGNYIGTDASGAAALPNNYDGVWIGDGARYNIIGPGNLISGNGGVGVTLWGSGTVSNTIAGNLVGTDASGMTTLGNTLCGIVIMGGANYNVVGGTTPSDRNVVSGNIGGIPNTTCGAGIAINESHYNRIVGNYVGTNINGTAALGNAMNGVESVNGAHGNVVERNVISGNEGDGVLIHGTGTMSNTITSNLIGTDASGTAPLGNGGNGVNTVDGAMYNTVGGQTLGEGNVIAANAKDGILIWDASHNVVIGNLLGTDASGTADLGNDSSGLTAASGASYNRIENNVISGNGDGVEFVHADTVSNTVIGNYIGLDATGTLPLGNDSQGVYICSDSSHNRIGGSDPGEGNIIAYNRGPGVRVNGDNTIENTITRNSIHSNVGLGIVNVNGGNRELATPVITRLTAGDTITGTACADCTVEVFSDDADEGRIYEGTTTADGSGRFSFSKPGGFTGPNVTATATDADGNTSEFSAMVAQRWAENVELVSQIGGIVDTVAISGTLAYIGAGPRLIILDISDPANAAIVGRSGVLPGRVMEIVLAQDYAYVAGGYQGLRIIDVSDPTSPSEVGFYDTPGHAWGIAVAAGDPQGHTYAYVADGAAPHIVRKALRIIDVSDPANPSEVGSYEELEDARDVTVVGSNAYVAGGGLHIINVSDPTSPSEIGSYFTPRSDTQGPPPSMFGDVVVAGNYAYLAEWPMGDPSRWGLLIVDVSDLTEPTESGFYYGGVHDIVVRDNLAYVANPGGGLDVIDVSDPTEPTRFGDYSLPGIADSVAVAGDYAYVGLTDGGLAIVDISNPASPTGAGSYHDTPGLSLDVAVAGNYAYVAGKPMFGIVDISDPAVPTYTGFYDTAGYGYGVVVTGDYAYVTVGYYGLSVMDVSDPTAPSEVGFYDTPGSAYGVAIADSYAYVADGGSGLRVINITDPANPSEVGFYDTPGSARGVAVAAGDPQGHTYAYIADEDSGLRVIDISDPANPSEVGFYVYDTGSAYDVAVAGNYAYVADVPVWVWEAGGWIGGGLRIINIANPASPSEVGYYDTPGDAYSVTVTDSYAYVADRGSGLRVINVSDPTNPTLVGFYDTPGDAYSVTVTDSYAYVAEGNGGLAILRFRFHIYLPLVLKGY